MVIESKARWQCPECDRDFAHPNQWHSCLLMLEFLSNREIRSPRFQRVQPVGGGRVSHFIKLARPADIDRELVDWLTESYWIQSDP